MGRILLIAYLDTYVAAWLVEGRFKKLTSEARRVIQNASLLISPMVLLEFEYLLEIRRLIVPSTEMAARLRADLNVEICPFPFPQIAQAAVFEKWTRDSFDRLIVAHARANGVAPLLSADLHVQKHYSATVW